MSFINIYICIHSQAFRTAEFICFSSWIQNNISDTVSTKPLITIITTFPFKLFSCWLWCHIHQEKFTLKPTYFSRRNRLSIRLIWWILTVISFKRLTFFLFFVIVVYKILDKYIFFDVFLFSVKKAFEQCFILFFCYLHLLNNLTQS